MLTKEQINHILTLPINSIDTPEIILDIAKYGISPECNIILFRLLDARINQKYAVLGLYPETVKTHNIHPDGMTDESNEIVKHFCKNLSMKRTENRETFNIIKKFFNDSSFQKQLDFTENYNRVADICNNMVLYEKETILSRNEKIKLAKLILHIPWCGLQTGDEESCVYWDGIKEQLLKLPKETMFQIIMHVLETQVLTTFYPEDDSPFKNMIEFNQIY